MNSPSQRHAASRATRTHAADQSLRGSTRAALAVAGVLVLALLGTAGCTKKENPQSSATASTDLSPGPSGSTDPSAQPTASATAQPSPTGGSGQKPPSFPMSAKDYGLATLAAWASGSKSRLDLYATQAAVAQFMGHGTPNSQWTNLACEAAGDNQTACDYRNAHGDDARLTMANSQLGHPTATTDVFINRTQYSNAADQYVSDFMAAWQDGNKQRMTRYSSSSIAGMFLGKTPPTGTQTNATQSGSTWTVTVTGLPLGSGNWTFTVNGSKLGGGNAITAAKAN